jgi:hypothetical protein
MFAMQDNRTAEPHTEAAGSGEHPFSQDLNPNYLAGDNYGVRDPEPDFSGSTAHDLKGAHSALDDWQDDDLKQVPILPAGTRLQQGATYIDLRMRGSKEFTARGDQDAGPDNWYVPKDLVPYPLWNKLTGVTNPERLDEADDR